MYFKLRMLCVVTVIGSASAGTGAPANSGAERRVPKNSGSFFDPPANDAPLLAGRHPALSGSFFVNFQEKATHIRVSSRKICEISGKLSENRRKFR